MRRKYPYGYYLPYTPWSIGEIIDNGRASMWEITPGDTIMEYGGDTPRSMGEITPGDTILGVYAWSIY
jgi:hypothetical protein